SAFPATRSINFNAGCNGPGDQRKVHHEAFADNTMSTTILDRLMHHCHLLEFDGRSYRLKEAAEALARETKSN
ncbi:ATP-binding protein, partial [Mesorhizobium robiniae]